MSLNSKLAKHFALAAVATAAAATAANASVITTNYNIVIGATIDGLYLNVETGANNGGSTGGGSTVPGWDINVWSSSSMSFFSNSTDMPNGYFQTTGGTGTSNGPGDTNGPPFNADLPVQAGQTFALVVMNWTNSPNGYTIDFTQSTASLYDNINPYPVSVVPDCANQHFHVIFSEPVVTSSVSSCVPKAMAAAPRVLKPSPTGGRRSRSRSAGRVQSAAGRG